METVGGNWLERGLINTNNMELYGERDLGLYGEGGQ